MPYYKIAYSIAFVVILSAIQPVVYANEIGQAVERAVSLLAVVFCADTYLVEVQSKRSEVFCLYNLKKQAEVRDTIQRLRDERNMTILISSHILEELSKIATDYGIIHNGSLLQELTSEELMKRCSERIEIELIHPEQAVPILDRMGFTNYQVTDKSHIHIFERLNESANVNMELAKAGILVNGISITSEELETYFLNLTGGNQNA